MKKNPFVQGVMVATLGIVITKILGIIYVIPFYAIIGERGGALYSYAYSIYSVFLYLSSVGIPLAISKLTSEYNALGYYESKEKGYKIAKKILFTLSIISFIILILFAPFIAHIFIGDIKGGNTIEDVTFVIRMVSIAILIVPLLSVTRGYLQGHRFITTTSISQVIEQCVRILVIIFGSLICIKVLKLPLKIGVGVAVLGATIGAVTAYFYLFRKMYNNKEEIKLEIKNPDEIKNMNENKIIKQILIYAIPFVFGGLITSFYNLVDLSTIIKVMVKGLEYTVNEAEAVVGILSTWGLKLNMIVLAVVSGLTINLIPNITNSFAKKDMTKVKSKINRSIQLLTYIILPMTIGLSLLSRPVWTVFFGYNDLGSLIFKYSIFIAFFSGILTTLNVIIQSLNEYKKMFIFLSIGLLVKIIFNIPLMHSFHTLGFHASYGVVSSTIIGVLVSSILILHFLHKKIKINYEDTLKKVIDIIFASMIMAIVVLALQFIIPINVTNRLLALGLVVLYSLIGFSIYFYITIKSNTLYEIFGNDIIYKILIKLKLNKFIKKK